ncbi:DUF6946 family protein [Evansella clarkii]|uniref:DUF6946 family protein n=1 Tax=Evansella clarkii TaxID=79879 RepID=UPI000B44C0D7|nr:hypothetical protein [Evansella clarkii]
MGKFFVSTEGEDCWSKYLLDRKNQWVDGYSAKELAKSWEAAKGFPPTVQQAFKKSGISLFNNITFLYGFPEYKVSLPGRGASSQNDLYVLTRSGEKLIPVMVEGKVSEPFGSSVQVWKGKDPSPGKIKRLQYLLDKLQLDENRTVKTGYQLLHRTASAVIEAKKLNTSYALMLVHSFSNKAEHFEDYASFVRMYNLAPEEDTITGPVTVNGVNLYFGWVNH